MLVLAATSVAPLLGLVLTMPGATESTTVKRYALPLSPANPRLLLSTTKPESIVTVYVCATCPDVSPPAMATLTTVLLLTLTSVDAAETVTALPLLDGVNTMFPLLFDTASLKVSTRPVLSRTPLCPLLGAWLTREGTTMSATENE
jgi:hypothetical protein